MPLIVTGMSFTAPVPTLPEAPATTAITGTSPEPVMLTVSEAANCTPFSVSKRSPISTVPVPVTVTTPDA